MATPEILAELGSRLGPDAVSVDPAVLDRFSVDTWPLAVKRARRGQPRCRPDAVVRVWGAADVRTVVRAAAAADVPVTARGLGSSVTGQPLPTEGGIVIDLAGLTGTPRLNSYDLEVTVPAGTRGSDVEQYLNERGFTLGHSPQSLQRSSVGGWIATRASGQFSSRYGGIEDLVVGFDVVLADGEQVRLTSRPRGATGPDLRHVFIGAEGTMGIVTDVVLKVFPIPGFRIVEAFKLSCVSDGIEVMRTAMHAGLRPFLLRLYDQDESRHATGDDSFDGCVLFTGCEGTRAVASAEQQELRAIVSRYGGATLGADPVEAWMERRFDFSMVESILDTTGGYAETIEVAHNWSQIFQLYETLRAALTDQADTIWGHFSHAYPQGTSLYVILTGFVPDDDQAVSRLEKIWDIAMNETLRLGGELSHHHGVGLARLPYLATSLADSLPVLQRVKNGVDPAGVFNPGKLGLYRDNTDKSSGEDGSRGQSVGKHSPRRPH